MSKTVDLSSGSSQERLMSGLLGQSSVDEVNHLATTRYNSEAAEREDLYKQDRLGSS